MMPEPKQRPKIQLDSLEVAVLTFVVGLALWVSYASGRNNPINPAQSEAEMEVLRERYGPGHYTEREEEWMIRDYFQDRREGFFVDVGANHYQDASKTFYLESNLGWSGLAVEPQVKFAADYAKFRPRTKFLPFFVSDASNETARLYIINKSSMVASSNREFVKNFGEPDEARDVPTMTLTDMLDAEKVQRLDFLSMDIELHEPSCVERF